MKKIKQKCSWCKRNASKQTEKGKDNVKSGGLPVNDGWYCKVCWKKGEEMEKEAMYG